MNSKIDITEAIRNLNASISKADGQYVHWVEIDDDWYEPSWVIESCFLSLLALVESVELPEFRKMIYKEYIKVQKSEKGFSARASTPDGEPFSNVLSTVRQYVNSLNSLLPKDSGSLVTKDLLEILRDVHYVIADTKIFPSVPKSESDVHLRIEGILKCVFPDLRHKPFVSKQIKNFVPDTGIPSLRTLIEYKYLSRREDVGMMTDQILADTRGYVSKEWSRYVFVIYETGRFRKEKEWNQLLRDSDIPTNTMVVVLGGESDNRRISPKHSPRLNKIGVKNP